MDNDDEIINVNVDMGNCTVDKAKLINMRRIEQC
jgi:hypothetical protein